MLWQSEKDGSEKKFAERAIILITFAIFEAFFIFLFIPNNYAGKFQ